MNDPQQPDSLWEKAFGRLKRGARPFGRSASAPRKGADSLCAFHMESLHLRVFLFFFLLPSLSFAGTVTGTVTNATTGKPASGVDVILIQLQGTMVPVAQTKTDATGHYKLDNPALGNGPMLLRAVYRGVNYHEPATPGKATVDIEVFEPTEKPNAFSVTARAIILEPSGSDLIVNEEYLITNKTQPPVAFYKPSDSFEFSMPADAELGDVAVVGTSGMPVKQA